MTIPDAADAASANHSGSSFNSAAAAWRLGVSGASKAHRERIKRLKASSLVALLASRETGTLSPPSVTASRYQVEKVSSVIVLVSIAVVDEPWSSDSPQPTSTPLTTTRTTMAAPQVS